MFGKRSTFDLKRVTSKFLDPKKDTNARLKHLKHILENVDVAEAKSLFEANYSCVYHVFYDQFITVESNLRQRANKSYREELDIVLIIFEKILTLLPELLSRKWMCHSIARLMKKLLHPDNALKLRREAVRLFIIWYQILGDNAPHELHWIFACLVPGFQINHESGCITLDTIILGEANLKHLNSTTVSPVEINPILPPQSGDSVCEDHSQFFLEYIMDFIVTQVTKIEWRDKGKTRQQKCFQYLFEKFKLYYLPIVFSDFSGKTSLYNPCLDLPEMRTSNNANDNENANENSLCMLRKSSLIKCKMVIVRWVASFTHNKQIKEVARQVPYQGAKAEDSGPASDEKSNVTGDDVHIGKSQGPTSVTTEKETHYSYNANEDMSLLNRFIVKDTLYSNRENVNFIQEIFRQALLLPWSEADTIKQVVLVYKDWISVNADKPSFILEPHAAPTGFYKGFNIGVQEHLHSSEEIGAAVRSRLRNDSYLGAIHRENINVRAGLQNTLQVLITHAANVFLQEVGLNNKAYLNDQVEICKHVLNIYRKIVYEMPLEQSTWEQLLLILLHITSQILGETLPAKKEDTLGGLLAPALFQTLIVTWVKANLNVAISIELWDQFLHVLSSLTHWEELIREWAKTMEVLTKVLGKLVYGLDLNDLPLDRLSEQKQKRKRAGEQSASHHLPISKGHSINGPTIAEKDKRGISDFGSSKYNAPTQEKKIYGNRCRSISGDVTEKQVRQEIRAVKKSSLRRSQSETNLNCHSNSVVLKQFDSLEKVQHDLELNGLVSAASEQEVARILASAEEYIKETSSATAKLVNIRKSKSMEALRFNQAHTPSRSHSSVDAPSRSPSPSPSGGLETSSMKDSPMQIDGVSGDHVCPPDDVWEGNKDELRSIMSGGNSPGWLPDVAVALWRKMIGSLGDVNKIADPSMHARVLNYLVEIFETLVKLRENQGVTADNLSTPEPPDLIPPLNILSPWLFKAITLPNKYKLGKLSAYRLLCCMTVRHHDIAISRDHLVQFYNVLHSALCGTDQEIINTVVKYCGPRFFSLRLPGSSLLFLDFIHSADKIISSTDLKEAPRTEAMSILGSIICFPHVYVNIPVLKPNSWEVISLDHKKAKDSIVSVLLKSGCREPVALARCVALSSLAIYLYEELTYGSVDGKMLEALNVLLAALRQTGLDSGKAKRLNEITTKAVGQVVCDMLYLLTDHTAALLKLFPDVPKRIIEVLATTLNDLLQQQEGIESMNREHEQLLISLMFCLGEWCMRLQKPLVLQDCSNGSSLLHLVFHVLHSAYSGVEWTFESNPPLNSFSRSDFEYNLQINNLISEHRDTYMGKSETETYYEGQVMSNAFHGGTFYNQQASKNLVKLAARTIMTHLVNHLNHFPMGIGASRLTSMLNENDDNPGISVSSDDLSLDVFNLPNVQFFILNNQTLISFVELPMLDVPGGGVTAGTTTAKSQVRIIVRDVSGKFSWDASVLYGPSNMEIVYGNESNHREPEFKAKKLFFQDLDEPVSIVNQSNSPALASMRQRSPDVLPTYDELANNENVDNLSDLLQYIGHTSLECLYRSGQPLNIPQGLPPKITHDVQDQIMNTLLNQRNYELDYINRRKNDSFMSGSPAKPSLPCEPDSPFQHCRLMINQMGLMAWDKRSSYDLLKKNEKLLRELRNLDKQKCRETHKIAVIYVAEGQEDKNSVLMNTGGCQAYEEFVAGLAWEVELKTHNGFMGGLQGNGSTGDTAPYYANSFLEVIFHVATRMPSNSEESKIQKLRHLGNDEVQIVWSEHSRDYRRGIITTEFGDVFIVIYPLPNKLYRIQISRKPQVPFFGPLFDGAIVDHRVLPGLVRATAINASRATRLMMPAYQPFYKERAKALETITKNHKDISTFEEFTANVIMPNHQRSSQSDSTAKREPGSVIALSNLAAALLDGNPRQSNNNSGSPVRSHPSSVSSTSDQPILITAHELYHRVSESLDSGDGEERPTSPKTSKRLSLKGNARKTSQAQRSTPPESPTPKVKK